MIFMGIMIKMIIENGQCIDNPFKYSAERLKEAGGIYMCSCESLDPELLSFTFDTDGIKIKRPLNPYKFNFSEIIIKSGVV